MTCSILHHTSSIFILCAKIVATDESTSHLHTPGCLLATPVRQRVLLSGELSWFSVSTSPRLGMDANVIFVVKDQLVWLSPTLFSMSIKFPWEWTFVDDLIHIIYLTWLCFLMLLVCLFLSEDCCSISQHLDPFIPNHRFLESCVAKPQIEQLCCTEWIAEAWRDMLRQMQLRIPPSWQAFLCILWTDLLETRGAAKRRTRGGCKLHIIAPWLGWRLVLN